VLLRLWRAGLSPLLVITQACAHSAPSLGNEYKVVNWLRAAAIMAQIDPVAKGYLVVDGNGHLRLPPLAALGLGVNLDAAGQTNLLVEYQIHKSVGCRFRQFDPGRNAGPGAVAANCA